MHETKKLLSSTCKVNHSPKNKPASDCEVFIYCSRGRALCDVDDYKNHLSFILIYIYMLVTFSFPPFNISIYTYTSIHFF